MSDTSLTEEELGALLGDNENGAKPSPAATENNAHDEANYSALTQAMEGSLPAIKSEFSQKLGEEITVNFLGIERSRTLSVDGGGAWYVAKGSFATNGENEQILVFPDVMAHELAKRVTGVDDIENTIENVGAPLKELSDNLVGSVATVLGDGFLGSLGEFQLHSDLAQVEAGENFLRAGFSVDQNTFFYFFSATILPMLSKDATGEETTEKQSASDTLNVGEDLSSILSDDTQASNGNGKSAPEKESVFSSALSSLGDELLKEDSPVSDVEFPLFNAGGSEKSTASEENKRIDMLMDVQVTISVELGNTQRTVEEVLELGRGSILDLNKLAGEPLDIKVNDKLIAKGEVVVIDENFGVRIVEIIESSERLKK